MYCLCVHYPTPDDPAQFRDHYETRHLPLAERLPGLRSWDLAWPQPLGPDTGAPFCVFRGYFDSAEAMQKALMSEEGTEVAKDVPNYSPKGATMYHFAVTTKALAPA
ncbi:MULTISPECIES: EthD family reductase [Roseobacteraceae]|jgi:uncharacterized protein (TIGR02118 family)|uniref:EthD protein n=1 Tax=Phaeobacter inhibens TaxID=221822 RepID=A0A2I7KGH9_9RHOB|nr:MULTISPECIES: EthD family reductase [Roseobacteraceae]AUR01686.1 EthD protein [Phaeobacter inhibens]